MKKRKLSQSESIVMSGTETWIKVNQWKNSDFAWSRKWIYHETNGKVLVLFWLDLCISILSKGFTRSFEKARLFHVKEFLKVWFGMKFCSTTGYTAAWNKTWEFSFLACLEAISDWREMLIHSSDMWASHIFSALDLSYVLFFFCYQFLAEFKSKIKNAIRFS